MSDAAQPPVFDDSALAQLREDVGEEVTATLVGQYRKDAAPRVEEMEAGLEAGELERASAAGHALKSASAMVGLMRLSRLCQEMEYADDLAEARELLPRLREAFREGLSILPRGSAG